MKIDKFEDIESWKDAGLLVQEIYAPLKECGDFGFRDQTQRAAISVMSNIAESFERGGNRVFVQFLTIARGFLAEVKSLNYAAADIGYVDDTQHTLIHERCNRLGNLINGFIRYLQNSPRKK